MSIHIETDLSRFELIDHILWMESYRANKESDIETLVSWIWMRMDTTKYLREAVTVAINHFLETTYMIETSSNLLEDSDDELEEIQRVEVAKLIEDVYSNHCEDPSEDMDSIIMVGEALAELLPEDLGVYELNYYDLVSFTKDNEVFVFVL